MGRRLISLVSKWYLVFYDNPVQNFWKLFLSGTICGVKCTSEVRRAGPSFEYGRIHLLKFSRPLISIWFQLRAARRSENIVVHGVRTRGRYAWQVGQPVPEHVQAVLGMAHSVRGWPSSGPARWLLGGPSHGPLACPEWAGPYSSLLFGDTWDQCFLVCSTFLSLNFFPLACAKEITEIISRTIAIWET